jgi:hypothetical protein
VRKNLHSLSIVAFAFPESFSVLHNFVAKKIHWVFLLVILDVLVHSGGRNGTIATLHDNGCLSELYYILHGLTSDRFDCIKNDSGVQRIFTFGRGTKWPINFTI